MNKIEIIKPDDYHHHLRDGDVLSDVVQHIKRSYQKVLVMPNIKPPVRTLTDAIEYKKRISLCLSSPPSSSATTTTTTTHDVGTKGRNDEVELLMTLYLTDNTSSGDIIAAKDSGIIYGCKLYPAGATTNSEYGVTDIKNIKNVLSTMSDVGLPLLLHGEVVDSSVDIFDKEKIFIDTILKPVIAEFPHLKIIMEHITTADAVEFIIQQHNINNHNIAATITAHHLLYNRSDIFKGGICPHLYCLPILKRERHRVALLNAATSGINKFFFGSDSAPHAVNAKESSCGCAGIFTGHAAIELVAEAFDSIGKLDTLESFLSVNGSQYYGLPVNRQTITLVRGDWHVPDTYQFGSSVVRPLRAGENIHWKIE